MSNYYLGNWRWVDDKVTPAHFAAPAFTRGCIDFGTLPDMAKGGKDRPGCLLATDAVLPSEYVLIASGHASEIKTDGRLQSLFASELKITPNGDTLADLLRDLLQAGDPEGLAAHKPIMPDVRGWMELHLGGLVQRERFEWSKIGSRGSNHTAKVKDVIRLDMGKLIEEQLAKGGDQHQKCLDFLVKQYGLKGADDWKEFVPARLQKDVPGTKPHETTYTDNFNRADANPIDGTWTVIQGLYRLLSNQARANDTGRCRIRYDGDLSSDDHYAKFVIGADGSTDSGALCRKDGTSDLTYYSFQQLSSTSTLLRKYVSDTATNLNSGSGSFSVGTEIKCESNGSTIIGYVAGASNLSATDTSITGNLRGGISAGAGASDYQDNFECADLGGGGGGILYTQLERSVRGLNRGVYGGSL